jgi:hypothetical protein
MCPLTKRLSPLELDHLLPRSWGGSNRASNLAPACKRCNHKKGNRTATEFGHSEVEAQAKAPLRDAAAVNSRRQALYQRMVALGLRVATGTGGQTKWNRAQRVMPKSHGWTRSV